MTVVGLIPYNPTVYHVVDRWERSEPVSKCGARLDPGSLRRAELSAARRGRLCPICAEAVHGTKATSGHARTAA